MTHRGPFQPLLFCDSVILNSVGTSVHAPPLLALRRVLHKEEKRPRLIHYIHEIMICFPTVPYSSFSPVTVTQLLALATDIQKLCVVDAVDSSKMPFISAFAASIPFDSRGWSCTGFSVATKSMDSLNNGSLTTWGATWGGHIRCHQRMCRMPNKVNMIMCVRGPRRGARRLGWGNGLPSTHTLHSNYFLGYFYKWFVGHRGTAMMWVFPQLNWLSPLGPLVQHPPDGELLRILRLLSQQDTEGAPCPHPAPLCDMGQEVLEHPHAQEAVLGWAGHGRQLWVSWQPSSSCLPSCLGVRHRPKCPWGIRKQRDTSTI